jgi:SAM-dependent methyltransferase
VGLACAYSKAPPDGIIGAMTIDAPANPDALADPTPAAVQITDRACPQCGRRNDDAPINRYSLEPWHIRDCLGCGFVYIDQAPVYEALSTDLAWERTSKIEEGRREAMRPISWGVSKATRFRLALLPRKKVHDLIARHAKPGNVIDLGCGAGGLLDPLPPDYTPFGIEISKDLAASAQVLFKARGGSAIHGPALEGLALFPDGFFTGASLRSYLEHESQPAEVLRALHRVLSADGVAIVKVPNYASLNRHVTGAKWCGFRYPDHLNYFTPTSLRAMAARAGFSTEFGLTGRLPTSDNMWAILRKL